jgi:hypothetical protein
MSAHQQRHDVHSLYRFADSMCLPRTLCGEEARPGTCADPLGIRIGDEIFFSSGYVNPDGVTGCKFSPAVPVGTFAKAAE